MCGIAGIVDLEGERDIDRDALKRMADALAHRGPDGEGFYVEQGVGLAHRRLAIIDKAGGAQPFETDGGVLNFNGEIYNYEALGRDLARRGVALKTRSDAEVLAEGLAADGPDFINKLRGMFAFAFWNPATKTLLLARDRLGEKPLYISTTEDGFLVFASEIGALRASGLLALELNIEAVADYFFYGYTPDPKSIYAGVSKLPPGSLMTAPRGRPAPITQYWRPTFRPDSAWTFDYAQSALIEKLDDAVRAQMIADAPLGAFLSGGVDSAGIVAAMAQTGGTPTTCTIGFDDSAYDERAGAKEIAEKFGAKHHEHVATLDAERLIDDVAAAFGEPFADSSALPSYMVAALARQHVTVALSGDGGDEIFAGYRRYPFFLNEERVRNFAPLALRRALFGPAGALYPKLDWAPRPFRAKTTLQALAASRADGYANAVAINAPHRIAKLISDDLRHRLGGYDPRSVIRGVMDDADTDDPLIAAQYADLATWLPGRMLTKVDRASMAHGLEVRPPMLDPDFVNWAGALPPAFKLNNGFGKRVLKAAMTTRFGADYMQRPKRGFAIPVTSWLRAADSPLHRRLESSKAWRECGLLNERAVGQMIAANGSGKSDCGQELWSVIMFDAFLRNAGAS